MTESQLRILKELSAAGDLIASAQLSTIEGDYDDAKTLTERAAAKLRELLQEDKQ